MSDYVIGRLRPVREKYKKVSMAKDYLIRIYLKVKKLNKNQGQGLTESLKKICIFR